MDEVKIGWLEINRRDRYGKYTEIGGPFPLADGTHRVEVHNEGGVCSQGGDIDVYIVELKNNAKLARITDIDGDEWTEGWEPSNCADGMTWRI